MILLAWAYLKWQKNVLWRGKVEILMLTSPVVKIYYLVLLLNIHIALFGIQNKNRPSHLILPVSHLDQWVFVCTSSQCRALWAGVEVQFQALCGKMFFAGRPYSFMAISFSGSAVLHCSHCFLLLIPISRDPVNQLVQQGVHLWTGLENWFVLKITFSFSLLLGYF